MNIRPNTRDAVIEAAFQLLKQNPKASLADISNFAGVGRATLHRHFASREELSVELAKIALHELNEAANQAADNAESYTEALHLMLLALVPLADHQWFLAHGSAEPSEDIEKAKLQQSAEMADVVEAAKSEGGIASKWPTAWVLEVYDALLYAAWEQVRKQESTEKQATELAWNTFLSAMGR